MRGKRARSAVASANALLFRWVRTASNVERSRGAWRGRLLSSSPQRDGAKTEDKNADKLRTCPKSEPMARSDHSAYHAWVLRKVAFDDRQGEPRQD
jgi:hypothetical protein